MAAASISLVLSPALMPAASDDVRWSALRTIGYTGPGREGGGADATFSLELSESDFSAYSAHEVEPPSVAMVRFVCWLLVAPQASLAALSQFGLPAEDAVAERGAIGRTIRATIDYNLGLCAGEGADVAGEHAAAGADTATAAAMSAWRALFARRFGLPPIGRSLPARWAHLLLVASLTPADDMLPAEPAAAAIARRASTRLCGSGMLPGRPALGVHVEPNYLSGTSLSRIRRASHKMMSSVRPQAAHSHEPASVDRMPPLIQEADAGQLLQATCTQSRTRAPRVWIHQP